MSDNDFRSATAYLEDMQTMHDFLKDHPFLLKNHYGIYLSVYVADKESLAEMVKELGTSEKKRSEYYFGFLKKFGVHQIEVNAERERVCTKIKVGTKIVKRHDPEEVSKALAGLPEIETEEDVYEWECPESILRD